MNMEELISKIINDLENQGIEVTKKTIKAIYNSLINIVYEEANDRNQNKDGVTKIRLPKLGTFNIKCQDAYMGYNPTAKKKIPIEESMRIYFSASQPFKDNIQKKKK